MSILENAVTEPNAMRLWNETCARLQEVLHPDTYSRWIAVIDPVALTDSTMTLAVDNDFYQTWLEEHYLSLIKDALATVSDDPLELVLTVRDSDDRVRREAPPPPPVARKRPVRRIQEAPALNPKFTFDGFVVGSSNNFAHAASLAVAQAPARAYNPLFIYGGVGLGKTHLMQAIGHHVLSTAHATVSYLSSEAMLNEYIDALQKRSLAQFRKKYRNMDLLLIDDIHFLANKERLQEEFFHTFNVLFDAHKQIVMTSDRPASEIAGLEQRLVSRFEWGLVTELEPPDLETRVAILRHRREQAQVEIPDDLLLFIAQNVHSNIRRLEGAFIRLVSYASLTGKELTIESLRYLLRDTLDKERRTELTFDTIQRAVAEHYDLRLADMTSKRRPRSVSVPRQVAMFLCRRMTKSSLPDIANAFGKTHATVLHACKAIDGRMDIDVEFRATVADISRRLGRAIL